MKYFLIIGNHLLKGRGNSPGAPPFYFYVITGKELIDFKKQVV